MANTEFTISGLIESQLPDFINAKYADNAPSFRRFIELYYEWLENSAAGNTVYHIMNAEKYRDIDETEDSFITYFKNELLPYFPERGELELVKILKGAKEFYQKKGTVDSIEWLFRVLFNKEAIISHPRDNILRTSDGKWNRPVSLKVSDTPFIVQTTESTQNLYASNASPVLYHTQNTFSTTAKFTNTMRRDSTVLAFVSYKIWVESSTAGSTLKANLSNYINVNPSTAVTDNVGSNFVLVDRIIGDDLSGYGVNQHGFQVVECHYNQAINVSANRVVFNNYMTIPILESVFGSASDSVKFQFDGIEAFEVGRLGENQLIASNARFESGVTSIDTTLNIDGANTPFYVFSFAKEDVGQIIYPDSSNFSVLSNTTFGEDRYALHYTKKYRAQEITSSFTSDAAANVATITLAFKEREPISLKSLVGNLVIGETSYARGVIERAIVRIDEYTKTKYTELFLSNIEGEFINNELIKVDLEDTFFTERIIGFVNALSIDPNYRGLKYKINDPVTIYGGFVDALGNRPTAGFNYSSARVSDTTEGRILSVNLLKGGYGYREDPNTTITVIPDASDPPIVVNAEVLVGGVDTGNAISLSLATDTIQPYASVVLSTNPFNPSPSTWGTGFPINSAANVNSVLADCLDFQTIDFYPISSLILSNQGQGYLREPTLQFETLYPINGGTASVSSLGLIAAVEIVDGGENYSGGDTLVFSGGGGSSATATVTVDGGGTITDVTITSRGYGYSSRPDVTVATSTGTGASLIAYLFNDGVEYDLTVEEVGQILSLEITNTGFGYIAKPNVSLKVMDAYSDNLTRVFSADQELTVYQGSVGSPTFRAGLDIGYMSSLNQAGSANATIRLYEYDGSLSLSEALVIAETGDHLNLLGSLVYGNGLARANLLFIDGTTTYQGYYLNTDGFLSSDKKLQDRYKYHNFSYVLESDKQLKEYEQTLKNIAHPAGAQLIAHKRISDMFNVNATVSHGATIIE